MTIAASSKIKLNNPKFILFSFFYLNVIHTGLPVSMICSVGIS